MIVFKLDIVFLSLIFVLLCYLYCTGLSDVTLVLGLNKNDEK